jgi:hypothetical protein
MPGLRRVASRRGVRPRVLGIRHPRHDTAFDGQASWLSLQRGGAGDEVGLPCFHGWQCYALRRDRLASDSATLASAAAMRSRFSSRGSIPLSRSAFAADALRHGRRRVSMSWCCRSSSAASRQTPAGFAVRSSWRLLRTPSSRVRLIRCPIERTLPCRPRSRTFETRPAVKGTLFSLICWSPASAYRGIPVSTQ